MLRENYNKFSFSYYCMALLRDVKIQWSAKMRLLAQDRVPPIHHNLKKQKKNSASLKYRYVVCMIKIVIVFLWWRSFVHAYELFVLRNLFLWTGVGWCPVQVC